MQFESWLGCFSINIPFSFEQSSVPFAIIGSNTVVEIGGKRVRGRVYPWGIAEGWWKYIWFLFFCLSCLPWRSLCRFSTLNASLDVSVLNNLPTIHLRWACSRGGSWFFSPPNRIFVAKKYYQHYVTCANRPDPSISFHHCQPLSHMIDNWLIMI